MNRKLAIFFQIATMLVGLGILGLLLWEPHVEGVNANAAFFDVYLDPFIAVVYVGSIPFFVGLYQIYKVFGLAGKNNIFSQATAKALQIVKYSVLITAAAIVGVDVYIRVMAEQSGDDPAGAIALGILATLVLIVIATLAAVLERRVQNALSAKSVSDLSV